jgi:hypothetical protein
MIELTKVSAEKVHKLFQFLKRLELYHYKKSYGSVDDVYDAWRFAERNDPVIKKRDNDECNR